MISPIDEIKAKLDLIEVISEYVNLSPAGTNMKALCPFHSEKMPSFFVSSDKQIWKCFGCGAGGSIFDFIMQIEGVDFPQALRILAKKAGVVLKSYDPYLTSQRTKILDICQETVKYYHQFLLKAKAAEMAKIYLKERKISPQTIKDWQIGFAPKGWRILFSYLISKGFKTGDIEAAGLIIRQTIKNKQQTTGYYDRFRNRIIFPINDIFGNAVGFTGRIMPDEEEKEEVAKYINTPETLIYNKSRLLYGLDKAKLEIRKMGFAVLVEGNTDVLTSWQAGVRNVIAVSGSALTLTQVKLLKRYSQNLCLSFDLDPGGEAATKRGIDIALKEEMEIKIITLSEGKDPDECIKKNPQLWLSAIEKAQPIMEYYFSSTFQKLGQEKISARKEAVKILLPLIAKLGNLVERDIWLKKLASQVGVSYETIRESFQRLKTKKQSVRKEESFLSQEFDQTKILEEKFLGLLLKYPEQIASFYEEIGPDFFQEEKAKQIMTELKKYYSQLALEEKKVQTQDFKESLTDQELVQYIDFLILLAEKDFTEENKKEIDRELEFIFQRLKRKFVSKKLKILEAEIQQAEEKHDKEKINELSQQFQELSKKLIDLT